MEKVKLDFKIQLILAIVCVIFGMGLLTAGFIVPPIGIIDTSLLTMWGETLTFTGYCLGVDYNYKFKEKLNKLKKTKEE